MHLTAFEVDRSRVARYPGVFRIDLWERVDCSEWEQLTDETQSSKDAQWLRAPDGVRWLYKAATVQEYDGRRDGEDWAELLATLVARELGIPCAHVRLCVGPLGEGTITRTVIPPLYNMHEGLVWVPDQMGMDQYDPRAATASTNRPGHSLETIRDSLRGVAAPPDAPSLARLDGFDTFAGYLCLDALIANRDRHEQNWGVLEPSLAGDDPIMLAPSFDHASAFGYNLTENKRKAWANDPALLLKFALGGTAHRFEHPLGTEPPTLVEAAAAGMLLASQAGREYWGGRIHRFDPSGLVTVVMSVPCEAMSEDARTMAMNLLDLNLRRLRDELDHRI